MGGDGDRLRVLVPRLFDAGNTNAQNLNAKALLARFRRPDVTWRGLRYDAPDPDVAANPQVRLTRLWRRHLWPWHVVFEYQNDVDAIFYPGAEWFDESGIAWRTRVGRRVPVISTFEGLAGDADTENRLSEVAGHQVHCHRVERRTLERVRAMLDRADHVIAISPFLARMGRVLHGDKFSVLPLGVDTAMFRPRPAPKLDHRPVVVSAGRVAAHKRPRTLIDMAQRFPGAQFKWFGEGADRRALIAEVSDRRLGNVEFPGARMPSELAEEFRGADIFLLPSHSEGAPKVVQEAAASGLPVIAFGFYESPAIVDGSTGFVVWNDREMEGRLGQLIHDAGQRRALGAHAHELSRTWGWDRVASEWEERVVGLLRDES